MHDKIRCEAAVLCDSQLPAIIIIMTDTKMVLVFRSFLLVTELIHIGLYFKQCFTLQQAHYSSYTTNSFI